MSILIKIKVKEVFKEVFIIYFKYLFAISFLFYSIIE